MIIVKTKDKINLNTKGKYCPNDIEVMVDSTNLTPENIVSGKTILGVAGAATTSGGIIPTGTIEITENGTYNVTGYASAEVSVEGSGEIPEGYIKPEGGIHFNKNTLSVDISQYQFASVNVIPDYQFKTVTPTKELIKVEIDTDEGYNALGSVTVNPIPDEYIIPEGNINITENGTVDVTNYASAEINIPPVEVIPEGYILPSGNFEITANGDYDISDKESVSVNVPTSGEGGDTLWANLMNDRITMSRHFRHLFDYHGYLKDATPYLAGYDTTYIKNTEYMFNECHNLTTVPYFKTDNVTDMKYMFHNCKALTAVPAFNTSQVTNMSYMFYYCQKITSLPQFDTSKVQNFNYAFTYSGIEEAVINTDSATNIGYMFQYCEKLKRIEISSMDKVTSSYNAGSYAQRCYNLRQFIIRNATTQPIFYNSQYSYPFVDCCRMLGTFHKLYNPEALQDSGIYVRDEWV
jgi:surface protein